MATIAAENVEGCVSIRAGDVVTSDHLMHDALITLQELRGGGSSKGSFTCVVEQLAAEDRIRVGATRMCTEQPELSDKEVFGSLAGLGLEYFETTPSFTPLVDSLLSLPAQGAEPQPLSRLLGPTGVDEVASFCKSVLPTEVCAQRLASADAPRSYLDPKLRSSPKAYAKLIQRLVRCGVLCYGTEMLCDVGIFAVAKKSGQQRLVVDARRANLCFDTPPGVSLPTAASFARLELQAGEELHCSQFDLSDAFYQFELPHALRPYFCLPTVRCREVGVFRLGDKRFCDSDILYPQFRAMPMGWSHALAWCQKVFSRVAVTAAPHCPLLSDTCPTPDLSLAPVLSVYVDNLAVIGTSAEAVRDAAKAILVATHQKGLKTHEEEESSQRFQLLGLAFEDGVLAPKTRRLWKLWQSLRFALRAGALTFRNSVCLSGTLLRWPWFGENFCVSFEQSTLSSVGALRDRPGFGPPSDESFVGCWGRCRS